MNEKIQYSKSIFKCNFNHKIKIESIKINNYFCKLKQPIISTFENDKYIRNRVFLR